MAETNPLYAYFSFEQGRLKPVKWDPPVGEWSFILGSEDQYRKYPITPDDYAEIYQDFDLTGVNIIRLDAGFIQPCNMPDERDISSGATLKRSEVFDPFQPYADSEAKEEYPTMNGTTLDIVIDGGATQTVTFSAVGYLTAQDVVDQINALPLVGAVASTYGGTDAGVRITSNASGLYAAVQVSGGTANPILRFPTRTYLGGDDLSVIIAPDADFTDEDEGCKLSISGTAGGVNDMDTSIMSVISSTKALLKHQVIDEATGFTAIIKGFKWRIVMLIDDVEVFGAILSEDRRVASSDDLAINVSKLTGSHKLAFRLQLVEE